MRVYKPINLAGFPANRVQRVKKRLYCSTVQQCGSIVGDACSCDSECTVVDRVVCGCARVSDNTDDNCCTPIACHNDSVLTVVIPEFYYPTIR